MSSYNNSIVPNGTFRYLFPWIFSGRWSIKIKLNQYLVPSFLVLGLIFWKYVLYPMYFWVLPTFTTVGFYQMDGFYFFNHCKISQNSKLLFLSLLIYYLYKNTIHDMCHHVFMYDVRDKNTNSQTNDSIKYISNTHGGVI